MKITLTFLEIVALQKVSKNPGHRLTDDFREMETYRLVEAFEDGYQITEGGKLVLNLHVPYLCNGQNMKEPLGMVGRSKRRIS